jgi:diguanylate cyclase (GGDEF)-like protein
MHGESFRRDGVCELHRPDGTVSYVIDTVSPVPDATGQQKGLVVVFRDAAEELLRERELRQSALQDALTGLCTRAEFLRRLHAVHVRSQHVKNPVALLAVDLDRFKAVNDGAGHAAGDAMLRKVADAFRRAVRSHDTVARLGGDEFALLLEDCSPERALAIGRQLCAAVEALVLEWDGKDYHVGASIGIAVRPEAFAAEQDWLVQADKACYAAKNAGRGTVVLAPGPEEPHS